MYRYVRHHTAAWIRAAVCTTLTSFAALSTAAAQFPPERLENIEALPKDMEVRQLINVMRAFSAGLGVRCQHCHVGEDGQPLSTYDFVSDEKVAKRKAREMIRLVQEMNGQFLANLEERGVPPVEVRCVTCHRGQARPVLIEDALKQAVEQGGPEAGVAKYRELRERYYGSHTYDFRESVLANTASDLWQAGDKDAVFALANLNLEFFPESGSTHTLLGQAYAETGERDKAIQHLEKALALNPRNQAARRLLTSLTGGNR